MNGLKTVRLIVSGRVQGVGYRAWLARQAKKSGLSGWVRNRADGAVEAVLDGPESTVETMIEKCRDGPRAAVVSAVTVSAYSEPLTNEFKIRPTV